jgi:hypothetical protein
MSLSNEQLVQVLKAAITTSSTEGIASPQDADAFIDLSREQTSILQELRHRSRATSSRRAGRARRCSRSK